MVARSNGRLCDANWLQMRECRSAKGAVCYQTNLTPTEKGQITVEGTLLASNLGFPEGPVVMPDGSIVICDGNTGELLRWDGSSMSTFSAMGGSPWGAVLGSDGAVYVTQGGNVPGSPDQSAVAGIQRVNADGSVETLSTEIGGHALAGPNDLAFGPDGRLWFTDSGTEQDDRFAAEDRAPGRLFGAAMGQHCCPNWTMPKFCHGYKSPHTHFRAFRHFVAPLWGPVLRCFRNPVLKANGVARTLPCVGRLNGFWG